MRNEKNINEFGFEISPMQSTQVNQKSFKPVYGKAAQYKNELNSCKFKLVVYWNQDNKQNYYSISDKQTGKNRRYIPSFDFINSVRGVTQINHENSFNSLMTYCLQNANRMDKAMIIVNDFINETEITVFIFNPVQVGMSKFVQPLFKKDIKGNIFYDGVDGVPIRVDKMRFTNK